MEQNYDTLAQYDTPPPEFQYAPPEQWAAQIPIIDQLRNWRPQTPSVPNFDFSTLRNIQDFVPKEGQIPQANPEQIQAFMDTLQAAAPTRTQQ